MQNMWGLGDNTTGQSPYSSEPIGRVVPADGDPEVDHYRASLRAREQRNARPSWLRGRHTLRNWAIALVALALVVLFIKPLLVFAVVVVGAVLGLLVLGLLAAGALLLAVRLALGGRLAYHQGRSSAYRRTGRWRM
jgi:hypothetical protein